MDTVTHLATGAAIGGLAEGKNAGKKAMAWGAFFSHFPDLDVIIGAFLPDMQALALHRGITHSFFFAVTGPFLLGLLPWYFHKKTPVSYLRWTLLAFLAIASHLFLDIVTSYGTQLYMPCSNKLTYTANLSIIDPLFSLPILIAAIAGFFSKIPFHKRQKFWIAAFVVSALYLSLTFWNKQTVNRVFSENFTAHEEQTESFITQPTLFNNVLWRGVGRTEEGYLVGFYSLLDSDNDVELTYIPRNTHLLEDIPANDGIETLKWFGDGFYQIEEEGPGQWRFHNLRFGRSSGWQDERSGNYAFSYRVKKQNDHLHIKRVPLSFGEEDDRPSLRKLWRRILGD